ncbi:hypothetical protein FS837_010153 [Tulasnella sp. UAMH 9824]|nr:hypothetical protein FS837_010153 [Tulasnella sp. UAMH 9824]
MARHFAEVSVRETKSISTASDGEAPCTNCLKAHAHAFKLDPLTTPSEPRCTYDDADLKSIGPKARIATLESENAELRKQLEVAEGKLAKCTCRAAHSTSSLGLAVDTDTASPPESTFAFVTTSAEPALLPIQPLSSLTVNSTLNPPFSAMSIGSLLVPQSAWDPLGIDPTPITPPMSDPGTFNDLTRDIWPLNIPPPDTLHHLVEIFFSSVPLASRLIHKPSFMISLQQVPTSPEFPHISLLHAICGVASLYSPVIRETASYAPRDSGTARPFNSGIILRPNAEQGIRGEHYFPRRVEDILEPGPDGFGSMHIRWATDTLRLATRVGDRLLQLLQAAIIITWYHYSRGLVIGVYAWLGSISKYVAPLGLNVLEGFEPLSLLPYHMLFLLGKPKSPIEAETVRAMIQLHDPHANFSDSNDPSTIRLAAAVQSILELIYAICATSFDLIFLDHASSFCWFVAGATIIHFLKAKMGLGEEAEVARLTQELNVVKFVLGNLGDRTMIGLRQIKLLEELYEDEINPKVDR